MAGRWARVGWVVLGLAACSNEPSHFTASSAGGSAKALPDRGADASAPDAARGAAPDADLGVASDAPTFDAGFCTGQAVSVKELASGSVRGGALVLLSSLVASSQKFLLSASKTSGKCWWAAFAAEEGASGENSGVLLLSSADSAGPSADGGAPDCPSGADSLPDDLAPGDRFAAFGSFSEYVPDSCSGTAAMRELLIKPGCTAVRAGHGAPPPAVLLTPELGDRLARGTDRALLDAWSGARVELDDVNALAVDGSSRAVGPYGVISFAETKLELHSKVPYSDLSAGGPHQSGKSLDFSFPVHFERAIGVLFLDYCTWSLEVCDRCVDLSPQSRGCPASGG